MGTDPTTTDLPVVGGTWSLDAMHSDARFKVHHIGLSDVHGSFNRFEATLGVRETLRGLTRHHAQAR